MLRSKKLLFIIFLVILISGIVFVFYGNINKSKNFTSATSSKPDVKGAKVKYPQDFTIVIVGDSMTERLGNSDEIRSYLSRYYPDKTFEVLNYGFGATSILSIPDRLTKPTQHAREFRPILDIDFDLIIIESFGHNPLSEYPLNEGLKKQDETLDNIVSLIKKSNPKAKIAFLATLAPNKKNYALNQVDLSPDVREKWANERVAYIQNHIKYANSHNIPLINVYEKSLNTDKDGDLKYIDKVDYIHPSPSGIYLISQEIVDTIFNSNLFN